MMMIEQTVDVSPLQMAKRIGKTRSLFVNDLYQREKHQRSRAKSATTKRRQSEIPQLQQFYSMPMLPHRCRSSEVQLSDLPEKGAFDNLNNRVSNWLRKSNPDLLESDIEENAFEAEEQKIESINESEEYSSDQSNPESVQSVKSEFSEAIIQAAEETGLPIEEVPWSKSGVDTLLKVKSKLFPIDRGLLSYVSIFFKKFFEQEITDKKEEVHVVELRNQDCKNVFLALKFIYSCEEEDITDENVAYLLLLSEEFEISRLRFYCDQHLQHSTTFNPLIALQLAKKYNLPDLVDIKCQEISKVKGFERTKEFKNLDCETQNKILINSLERYSRALKVFTQFDVYLCAHHGKNPKQSDCCFRAATYDTVNDRTYLLKMEDPAQNVIKKFEELFKSDFRLLSESSSGEESIEKAITKL